MGKGRLEAFSDGVIAIIITIIVLEIKVPHGADLAALRPLAPVLFVYALTFANVTIFWNNHHHMLHASSRVNGAVLWTNSFLLFWLSLMPLSIRWMDESHFAALPVASYGFILLGAALGYSLLERMLVRCDPTSRLAQAVGSRWKETASTVIYTASIPLAFVHVGIAIALYVASAVIWFLPDRRIERLGS